MNWWRGQSLLREMEEKGSVDDFGDAAYSGAPAAEADTPAVVAVAGEAVPSSGLRNGHERARGGAASVPVASGMSPAQCA